MHGVFDNWRSARLYLLAWLMLGLLLAGMLAAGGASWGASLLFALPLVLVYAYAAGYSTYYVCRSFPLGQAPARAIAAGIGLSAACVAALWCAMGAAWSSLLAALSLALAPDLPGVVLSAPLLASMFGVGVILYGLSAALNYLMLETERVRRLETLELETRLMARDAELRMLRTQVDPHFLFNSLNSISALTAIDPAGARAMTLRLADFFRHSLGLKADRKVTLDEELGLVRHFLAIEQVRFGERLHVEFAVEDAALSCLLPPMLLQPLAENAVKHGIGRMLEPGRVRIVALRAGSLLRIDIENDVDPEDAPEAGKGRGIGLDNVRQRLAAAYGHEAAVRWSKEAGHFRVALTLPAETHNEEN